ncbi:MAG: MauE/DoxX family redox-associated membrane protein [Phycisphaerales bacterium JB039]
MVRQRLGEISGSFGFGALLIMGLAKAIDVAEFQAALRTWDIIPVHAVGAMTLLVPAAEVLLAMLWFTRQWPRGATIAAIVLIGSFSAAFGFQVLVAEPPQCGCFGVLARYYEVLDAARLLLWRNAVLTGLLFASLFLARPGRPHGANPQRERTEGFQSLKSS